MKRKLLLTALLISPLLFACANLMGSQEQEISLQQMQAVIDQKFPYYNRYLGLLELKLSNPSVSLSPDNNRIRITMDTTVLPLLMERSWHGSLALTGTLMLDQQSHSIIVANPHIEDIPAFGTDAVLMEQVRLIGGHVAESVLSDLPLVTFNPKEANLLGTRFTPSRIATRPDELVVTFEPIG